MDGKQLQRTLNDKKAELKTLQQKFDLNNKKIKLLRKQNEELKNNIEQNNQSDTAMLLNSKDLSDANSKLQAAIEELQEKLKEPIQAPIPQFATIKDLTVTNQTLEVDLSNKELTDEQFSQLTPFTKIESLILDSSCLQNSSVQTICLNFKALKKLMLNVNKFQSPSLAQIGNLSQLKSLQIGGNNLGDQCIEYISHLAGSLTQLSISKNKLTDKNIYLLPKLTNLTYLDMTNNQISDDGAKDLLDMKNITHLYIGWNKISILGARWINKSLQKLKVFEIRYNTLGKEDKQNLKAQSSKTLQIFC